MIIRIGWMREVTPREQSMNNWFKFANNGLELRVL